MGAKNQHQWGVVAQTHEPYREFEYCPLCRHYREATAPPGVYIRRRDIPVYATVPDSNIPFHTRYAED